MIIDLMVKLMQYLTVDELRNDNSKEAHEIIGQCIGKSIRDNFAVKIFHKYCQQFFQNHFQVKILDLGSGSGGFIQRISQLNYTNTYGVDLDDYIKPENKSLFKEFKTADLSWQVLPWPDNFFDIVAGWCVLPHLENPFHCIREIRRVLNPGGLFIFTTPYLTSKPSLDYFIKHKDFGSYRASNNHLVLFPDGVMKKSVLKYFDLLSTEYHFRTKIFHKGFKGQLRYFTYQFSKKISPNLTKKLAKRWSYNVIYILRKKS